ncbi:MAG: hypothetical protein ACXWID_02275 [Pyrinomonadaceae bacterium]
MTKAVDKRVERTIAKKRRELIAIRTEIEDLLDYLVILESRARDAGKSRLSHDEIKKRYASSATKPSRVRNGRKAA